MQKHQSALIIGNQQMGWVRVSSWASPAKLAQVIDGIEKTRHWQQGSRWSFLTLA